jgi:hypothetical protein
MGSHADALPDMRFFCQWKVDPVGAKAEQCLSGDPEGARSRIERTKLAREKSPSAASDFVLYGLSRHARIKQQIKA